MATAPVRGPQLRASYVWAGEVMADEVFVVPQTVTLGSAPDTTFITAPLGLPESYAVLRPGQIGYVLTISNQMTGKLSLAGREVDVEQFAREGSGSGSHGAFRATAVSAGDWGVIHLDGAGDHTLFFQFVDPDPPIPKAGWRDSELLLPAIAFSVFMHAAFLAYAFIYYQGGGDGFGFPGSRELVAGYLVNRPEPMVKEPEPKSGDEGGEKEKEQAATKDDKGKKGGEGKKPRKRSPRPRQGKNTPKSTNVGLVTARNRKAMKKLAARSGIDKRLGNATDRLQGRANDGGFGRGRGEGGGVGNRKGSGTRKGGDGRGGGGKSFADTEGTNEKLDTGSNRKGKGLGGSGVSETKVSAKGGKASGKLGGLTEKQIRKVVMARRNAIRNCYERQLQRSRGLAGRVVIRWKIGADGRVKGAKVSTSSLNNGAAEDCIVRQFSNMKFPSPGSGEIPVVKFPFIFRSS